MGFRFEKKLWHGPIKSKCNFNLFNYHTTASSQSARIISPEKTETTQNINTIGKAFRGELSSSSESLIELFLIKIVFVCHTLFRLVADENSLHLTIFFKNRKYFASLRCVNWMNRVISFISLIKAKWISMLNEFYEWITGVQKHWKCSLGWWQITSNGWIICSGSNRWSFAEVGGELWSRDPWMDLAQVQLKGGECVSAHLFPFVKRGLCPNWVT
jgi:hypothetical protein